MSTTATSDETPVTLLPERARWLASMAQAERDMLPDLALREVDARFAAWLQAGGGGGGEPPR